MELGIGVNYPNYPEISKIFENEQVTIVENSPEEISDLAIEQHLRLTSNIEYSPDDLELHSRFFSLVEEYRDRLQIKPGREITCRIGTQFLKDNQSWLG